MAKVTGGQIVGMGLVGGAALAIYGLYKGWWQFPNILGWIGGDVGRGAAEGAATGGLPGAIGGATYNIFQPGELTAGERVEIRTEKILLQEPDLTPGQAKSKAAAQIPAEDVLEGPFGLGPAANIFPPFGAWTIGAGLGAAQNWTEYLDSLSPKKKQEERYKEYTKRESFILRNIFDWGPVGAFTRIGAGILAPWHFLTRPSKPTPSQPLYKRRATRDVSTAPTIAYDSPASRSFIESTGIRTTMPAAPTQPPVTGAAPAVIRTPAVVAATPVSFQKIVASVSEPYVPTAAEMEAKRKELWKKYGAVT